MLGSGVVSAACVIDLGSKRGSGLLGAACMAKGAGLRGGARRRAIVLVSGVLYQS